MSMMNIHMDGTVPPIFTWMALFPQYSHGWHCSPNIHMDGNVPPIFTWMALFPQYSHGWHCSPNIHTDGTVPPIFTWMALFPQYSHGWHCSPNIHMDGTVPPIFTWMALFPQYSHGWNCCPNHLLPSILFRQSGQDSLCQPYGEANPQVDGDAEPVKPQSDSGYRLVWRRSLKDPVCCLGSGDLLGDGVENLFILSLFGMHVMQVCCLFLLCVSWIPRRS